MARKIGFFLLFVLAGSSVAVGQPFSRMDVFDRVERRRELGATVERLDRFAGVVSRDLRNPPAIVTESHPYAEGMFLIGFGFSYR